MTIKSRNLYDGCDRYNADCWAYTGAKLVKRFKRRMCADKEITKVVILSCFGDHENRYDRR